MWPPTDVVNEHKKRANFIWVSLVMLIIGYSLWLIISTYQKRKNPTVNISIKDDRYAYPTITICVVAGEVSVGCDSEDFTCAHYMYTSIYNPVGFENINDDDDASNAAVLNEEYPDSCVDLDQSDMTEIEIDNGLFPPSLTYLTTWFLNSGAGSDNDDGEYLTESSEGAYVFFTDPEISNPLGSHNMSTFVGIIPFTRQLAGDIPDSFTQTAITMEMTESVDMEGTTVRAYSAGAISSKDYLNPNWVVSSTTQDRAIMLMEILQPDLTHTIRKEIDPLEWAELLGNIGGAWEILLILWGIFFIARHSGEPKLKGRDFVKTVRKGAQNIAKGATSMSSRVSTKRGLEDSSASERKETAPNWDHIPPIATTLNRPIVQATRPPPAYHFDGDQK